MKGHSREIIMKLSSKKTEKEGEGRDSQMAFVSSLSWKQAKVPFVESVWAELIIES